MPNCSNIYFANRSDALICKNQKEAEKNKPFIVLSAAKIEAEDPITWKTVPFTECSEKAVFSSGSEYSAKELSSFCAESLSTLSNMECKSILLRRGSIFQSASYEVLCK